MIHRVLLAVLVFFVQAHPSYAVPSFSKQTGMPCASCHLNYGELTPEGRKFKLMGYTSGVNTSPFSFLGVISDSKIRNTSSSLSPDVSMPKNGSIIPESGSLVVAGKISDHAGGYLQWTLNAANTKPIYGSQGVQTGTKVGSDSFLDASEVRYANETSLGNRKAIVGVTLNNAPGVQDVWVSSPVNSYPYRTSGLINAWGIGQFGPTTLIDGGLSSQVVGYGIYTMVSDSVYAEISNYQSILSDTSYLTVNRPRNDLRNAINPYWRLAFNSTDGHSSFMLGTFGMATTLTRDITIPGSSSGRYRDIGVDGGYQYITDKHSWTAQFTFISEQVSWNARSLGRNHDFVNSELDTLKGKVTYDYARTYGASMFGFYSRGSIDNLYWSYNSDPTVITGACNQNTSLLAYCSSNGKPDTSGYGFEFYYVPMPNIHIALQETFYRKFLGGAYFIDNSSGNIRAASDNNFTYLYMLLSF